ncbi:hypothetical protein Q7P37_000999 [Cladosporium fusiforme]
MPAPKPPTNACAHCGNFARAHCAGCTDADNNRFHVASTYYCNRDCQIKGRPSHKFDCRAAKASKSDIKKLFRVGQLLQEAFLATRAETFDLSVLSVIDSDIEDNKLIFYTPKQQVLQRPGVSVIPGRFALFDYSEDNNSVLSYRAGADVFVGMVYRLGRKAFEECDAKIEEVDVRVLRKHVLLSQYALPTFDRMPVDSKHHLLRVTLRDGSTWAVDLAGPQHGQNNPVMSFKEYKSMYVADVLAVRPYGTSVQNVHYHHQTVNLRDPAGEEFHECLRDSMEYQVDELEEWLFHNVTIDAILDSDAVEFGILKFLLVACVTKAAREYGKHLRRDPTSAAMPIWILDPLHLTRWTEWQKGRAARKKARIRAEMPAEEREGFEAMEARGVYVMHL